MKEGGTWTRREEEERGREGEKEGKTHTEPAARGMQKREITEVGGM